MSQPVVKREPIPVCTICYGEVDPKNKVTKDQSQIGFPGRVNALMPNSNQSIEVKTCGHIFHEKCLEAWIAQYLTKTTLPPCPNCRRPLTDRAAIISTTPPITQQNANNTRRLVANSILFWQPIIFVIPNTAPVATEQQVEQEVHREINIPPPTHPQPDLQSLFPAIGAFTSPSTTETASSPSSSSAASNNTNPTTHNSPLEGGEDDPID
jgi:hypothetical protein